MTLSQRSDLTQGVHRSSGAYELVAGAVLFAVIGLYVDRLVGTTPVFTIVLTVVGLTAATVSIYYRYRYAMAEQASARASATTADVAAVGLADR